MTQFIMLLTVSVDDDTPEVSVPGRRPSHSSAKKVSSNFTGSSKSDKDILSL